MLESPNSRAPPAEPPAATLKKGIKSGKAANVSTKRPKKRIARMPITRLPSAAGDDDTQKYKQEGIDGENVANAEVHVGAHRGKHISDGGDRECDDGPGISRAGQEEAGDGGQSEGDERCQRGFEKNRQGEVIPPAVHARAAHQERGAAIVIRLSVKKSAQIRLRQDVMGVNPFNTINDWIGAPGSDQFFQFLVGYIVTDIVKTEGLAHGVNADGAIQIGSRT
jgi:hypothetical protein